MTEEQRNDQGAPQQPAEPVGQPQPPAGQPASAQQFPQDQPQQFPQTAQPEPQQPQQPPMYAPQPQPVYPPAPLMQLTGGMKFGWLVVGLLIGIPGVVIAWLVNVDKMPQVKSDAVKFSLIGLAISIVLGLLLSFAIGGLFVAMLSSAMGGYGGYSYYGTW